MYSIGAKRQIMKPTPQLTKIVNTGINNNKTNYVRLHWLGISILFVGVPPFIGVNWLGISILFVGVPPFI